jgi:hypothetical protein
LLYAATHTFGILILYSIRNFKQFIDVTIVDYNGIMVIQFTFSLKAKKSFFEKSVFSHCVLSCVHTLLRDASETFLWSFSISISTSVSVSDFQVCVSASMRKKVVAAIQRWPVLTSSSVRILSVESQTFHDGVHNQNKSNQMTFHK